MTHLALSFLGSSRIMRDGAPVVVDRSKAVALLAYLALTERQHTRDAVAALLWPEHDQVRARANLRRALATLRAAIPGNWWAVGYDTLGLRPGSFDLDTHAFRRLVKCEGHGHPAHMVCPACMRSLEEAVALYRGDFLAGFTLPDCPAFEEWRFFEAGELRGEYARALEQLARALAMLNEGAHRRLMQLYALAGQRSAALIQYERCRRILADELRCAPEEATTALYRKIRDGELAPHLSDAASFHATKPPAQLLPRIAPSIGRERERAALASLLADPSIRLITLVGPGGIGKTHLGIQIAADQQGMFADGISFVSLATLTSADLLIPTIVDSLPIAVVDRRDPLEQLLEALRDRAMLLILDSFEHLLDGVTVITALLQHTTVKCLITSRERLNLSGEWVFPVEGLEVPEEGANAQIEECGAVRLFVQRARKTNASFSLRGEDNAFVAQICRHAGGMPLAIELAASWVPVLSCAEIARNLDLLATELRDIPRRHRSIRAVFDHSWQLLTDHERDVFMRLSVFRGGFTRAAAETAAGVSLRTLSALVGKSLV